MVQDRASASPRNARRLGGPLAVAAASILGAVAVLAHIPGESPNVLGESELLVCPWRALTGLDCPFCGATRATAALLRGNLLTALDHNAFYVLAIVPLLLIAWVTWTACRAAVRPFPDLPHWAWRLLLGAIGAWWVLRLVVPWLGSGLSA